MSINYSERIPNNVNLSDDRRLQRALENWQPGFLNWWNEMGPESFQAAEVYLRTATSVDAKGWATFGHLKMPDYRWGIFLAEPEPDRRIAFGEHKGEPVWLEVPGEHRGVLRRLIVTQGDTEPASVEQQRHLGRTCPSMYDLRNLFQVNVEEARHLWAMVYLLHAYFGRDGREEADALLQRRSGNADNPRILGAFNERTPDWLSFFMFAHFTDRDGKYQLASLAESGFDPLSRTCRFMLTEEAHHLFVGETGIGRVIARTCQLMKEHDTDRISQYGGIDLEIIQKYINFHYSVSLDLFGSELSSNAATYYASGLKGRFKETARDDDHLLTNSTYRILKSERGAIVESDQPALVALNESLRDAYIADCERAMDRWNKIIRESEIDATLKLPHRAFHRAIGEFRGLHVTPAGEVVTEGEWERKKPEWLPTQQDLEHVASLMKPVTKPGEFAGWISAPQRGINHQPLDFEYVRNLPEQEAQSASSAPS
ncbi:MAG: benzoyl-CoA 2,3-epoxidase subunit BoxB [Candidatus Binatus sp.]|uniref:benzoyl-CoA 2,3-epoxidase subunit BoxB n=1 Tax=Candidatus Binatus sp. TaxID=2811406 RepID=UPI002725D5FA|nr:benzoyl-CoA 2,3-epoxidase subunit BoxB [Candidatus Binatus sp.]MDO8431576.1 benzoyl-CoA 2,3-epoxidase subunit BoxB [Candidatus Binatus sp.]